MIRNRGGRLVALAIALITLPGLAMSRQEPGAEWQAALDELSAIEARIGGMLATQSELDGQRLAAGRDLRLTADSLAAARAARAEGVGALAGLRGAASRDLDGLASAEIAERERLEAAREGVRVASPLLLGAVRGRSGISATAVTLGLIQARHRERASDAVEALLEISSARMSRGRDVERYESLLTRYEAFAGMTLEELRLRHRVVSDRLDGLHAAGARDRSAAGELDRRRRELNELLANLGDPQPPRQIAGANARPPMGRPLAPRPALPPPRVTPLPTATPAGIGALRPAGPGALDALPPAPGGLEPAPVSAYRRNFWRTSSSDVHALAEGRVLYSGPFSGLAHLLVIDHGEGWTSVYGNLTRCELREGDPVRAGGPVGWHRSGEGAIVEPLWFEIRASATPVPIASFPRLPPDWEAALFGPKSP